MRQTLNVNIGKDPTPNLPIDKKANRPKNGLSLNFTSGESYIK